MNVALIYGSSNAVRKVRQSQHVPRAKPLADAKDLTSGVWTALVRQLLHQLSNAVRIRLTRELSERLDSRDPSSHGARDVFELPQYEAQLLIAEGWASLAEEPQMAPRKTPQRAQLLVTTTLLKLRTVEQLRRMREVQAMKQYQVEARRRAEDRIRDELHDLSAKTIAGSTTQP